MELTNTPLALPRACVRCPTSARERFVDLDVQIDYYGAVIICEECGIAVGQLLGMATTEERTRLEAKIIDLEEERFELLKKVAGSEGVLRGLDALGLKFVPEHRDPDILPFDAPRQGAVDPRPSDESPSEGDHLGGGEGTSPQSDDDQGVAVVRSDERSDADSFRLSI